MGIFVLFRLFGLGNSFELQVPTLLYTYSGICNHSPCELRIQTVGMSTHLALRHL